MHWGKPERESPKRTISTSGGLDMPVMTLGPEQGWIEGPTLIGEGNESQQRHWAPKEGGLWDPTSVGEENEAFFTRVWKPLPSKHILKTLRGSPKGKTQRGQYRLAVGLGCYKWYQSQTSGGVPARTLGPKGGWIVRSHIGWGGEERNILYNVKTSP